MRTLILCGFFAFALVACARSPDSPEPRTAKVHTVPEQHKAFVAEFQSLLKKHPEAAKRYRLADMGEGPRPKHLVVWKCEDIGEFGVDCKTEVVQ